MKYTFQDWQSGTPAPDGWDCADAIYDGGWTADELLAFMRATVRPWTPPEGKAAVDEAKPADAAPAPAPPPPAGPAPSSGQPVREARTMRQEQPAAATVTDIRTRIIYEADENWRRELVTNEEGSFKPNVSKNWALFLENHPDMRGVFAFDAFKLRVMLMRRPPWENGDSWEPRAIRDRDYAEAVMWLEGIHFTPKVSNIQPIVHAVADKNSFDRLREYLEGLKWDGRSRIDRWMTYYLGVDDTPYARTVARCWLVSSVARGLKPGCKVDTMPILEGPQGARKSSAVEALYGREFYTDELSDIGGKDAMMEMQGVWGIEIAEMHRFSQAETNQVKKFLSRQVDRYRPPYGRSVIETGRRCVLAGTINPEGNPYLRDPTGARRFFPMVVGSIDVDGIKADRDQLWAEAVHMFNARTPWWVQEEELPAVEFEQEKRTDIDVWTDILAPQLKAERAISQVEVLSLLSISAKDADRRHSDRIGRVMKRLGWTAQRDRSNGDDRTMFRKQDDLGGGEW